MSKRDGFSLIELLIVVGIILIIAAIAIPNLLRARISANESSAVSSVRSIMTAESAYAIAYPNNGYADVLLSLGGSPPCTPTSTNACLIDTVLASGTKAGYFFAAVGGTPTSAGVNTSFGVGAAPQMPNVTGMRRFCGVNDNVIHYDYNSALSSTPPTAAQCAAAPFPLQIVQ